MHGDGAVASPQYVGDRGAGGTGAARERLADAALEDPGADGVRRGLAPEADVGAVGEDGGVLDLGPKRSDVERVRVGDPDRALWVADRDVLEAEGPSSGFQFALPVRRSSRKAGRCEVRPAHVDRARRRAGDRRADLAGPRLDAERVGLGPPVAPEVEDRLARPVPRQLRLAAVRVEDRQPRDEARLRGLVEHQHAVAAGPEVRVAQPLDLARGQALLLEDEVVVAQGLPLLEAHSWR